MTAIAATFVDIRTVKSRGQVQLVFEVPISGADAVLAALGGIPQPAESRWVGIARLVEEPKQSVADLPESGTQNSDRDFGRSDLPTKEAEPAEPAKVTRLDSRKVGPWKTLSRAQRAGIRSNEPAFWAWLGKREGHAVTNADLAAAIVRDLCQVSSRAELDRYKESGALWDSLDGEFVEHLRQQETEARYGSIRR